MPLVAPEAYKCYLRTLKQLGNPIVQKAASEIEFGQYTRPTK